MSKAHWLNSIFRIKDPNRSIKFYTERFGMTLVFEKKLQDATFYFLATLPSEDIKVPQIGTTESNNFFTNFDGTVLGLLHEHNKNNDQEMNNGNKEPNRGFGHIAFSVDDVYKSCDHLEKYGTKFQKRPDDGRMKGLAFVLDEDGYWIEVLARGKESGIKREYNLSQTMIRVKDPKKTLPFYQSLGMRVLHEKHFSEAKFSLYFMGSLSDDVKSPEDTKSEESNQFVKNLFYPILEITHNHGTEDDPNFSYHNGNVDPVGFSRLTFLVDDPNHFVPNLEKLGGKLLSKEDSKNYPHFSTIVQDPDNYFVELIARKSNL